MPRIIPSNMGGERTIKRGEMKGEDRFMIQLHDGMPPSGILSSKNEMPGGHEPNFPNADTIMNAYKDEMTLQLLQDESLKQELTFKQVEALLKGDEVLIPMRDLYVNTNKSMGRRANPAIQDSISDFLANPNANKFENMEEIIVMGSLANMFGGGPEGEELAVNAMEVFQGKKEYMTDEELAVAINMESALEAVYNNLTSSFIAGPEGSVANSIVKDMFEQAGDDDAVARAWGVPNTGLGQVEILRRIQSRLGKSTALAGDMWQSHARGSLLEQFSEALGASVSRKEILARIMLKENETKAERMDRLTNFIGESNRNLTSGEVEGKLGGFDEDTVGPLGPDTPEARDYNTTNLGGHVATVMEIALDISPHATKRATGMMVNMVEPMGGKDISSHLAQNKVDKQNPRVRSAHENASGPYTRSMEIKKEREKMEAKGMTSKQIYDASGAGGLAAKAIPHVIPAISNFGSGVLEGAVVNVVKPVAGRGAAAGALQSLRNVKSGLAKGAAHIATPQGNLDDEEFRQVLSEGSGK